MVMQVSAGYFWTMFALAFVVGIAAGIGMDRSERRRTRAHLAHAVELLGETQAALAITGATYFISANLVRRVRAFLRDTREGARS